MDIRPVRIARVFYIFRSKRLCNDVFHVRVDESLKLGESIAARTGHMTHYMSLSAFVGFARALWFVTLGV